MNKDKKLLYSVSLIQFAVLFTAFFIQGINSRILTACLLLPLTGITHLFIKKRCSFSINKKEVLLLSTVVASLYVILIQMSGLFFQFYKNPYFVTPKALLTVVLPLAVIIVTTEIIRSVLLAQKNSFVNLLALLTCLMAEILSFSGIAGIISFNRFMDMIGLTVFPAISANVYYHYVSRRFGALPNIAFRLITTMYIYFFPVTTGMSDALQACIKIILPIIMLSLVSALFEKKKKNAVVKGRKASVFGTIVAICVVISSAMLISCQFRFGAIVIATDSMTGEINKGDMILYERYDDQIIKEGQVIIFQKNKNTIIHRVVKIEHRGNEVRYYTKGDANKEQDQGYITDADIVGLTDIKVAYVGFPTLWLRELLDSSN